MNRRRRFSEEGSKPPLDFKQRLPQTRLRRFLVTPVIIIEWGLEWIAWGLGRLALFRILGFVGQMSILVGVWTYVSGADERMAAAAEVRKQRQYEAWRVITTAHGQPGSGGRVQALEDLNADGVSLRGVDVSGAALVGVSLPGAQLTGARLVGVDLSGADLRGARLDEADLTDARLDDALLDNAFLEGANLTRASLRDAQMRGAMLNQARLVGALLSGTDLRDADLSLADLTSAALDGPRLEGAGFESANLDRALIAFGPSGGSLDSTTSWTSASLVQACIEMRVDSVLLQMVDVDAREAHFQLETDVARIELTDSDLSGARFGGSLGSPLRLDLRGSNVFEVVGLDSTLMSSVGAVSFPPGQQGDSVGDETGFSWLRGWRRRASLAERTCTLYGYDLYER